MTAPANRWLSPPILLGAIGLLGSVFMFWMLFESRVTRLETNYENVSAQMVRANDKLDRLIERR